MRHEEDSAAHQALRALCQVASARAAGWQPGSLSGSAVVVDAARVRRTRLLKGALVGLAGLLALAVVAAQFADVAPLDVAPAPAVARPVPDAHATLPAPVAVVRQAVEWQAGELRISFDAYPLPQAIAMLAQATGTAVSGTQSLQPLPVTLHLRTGDIASAWRQLLQEHTGYSVRCVDRQCQLWIGAGTAAVPSAAAAAAAAGHRHGADRTPAQPTPAAPDTESQPDGSC